MTTPPQAFVNHINDLLHEGVIAEYDFNNYRQSVEWRLWVNGYNAALKQVKQEVNALHNLGQSTSRLYGDQT